MDSASIIATLKQPGLQAVSFDIFDTLIERPALQPDDLFVLLNEPVKQLLQNPRFDFYQARSRIEHEAVARSAHGGPRAYTLSFEEIYDHFRTKYRLTEDQTRRIMELERDLERQLLAPRAIGRELFAAARKTGKRILCISDMYHNAAFLSDLLERNGFSGISAVYVSSEVKKRKNTGKLFTHVLEAEHLAPHELLHVGDNVESDFRIPLRMGIPACHTPSSRDTFRASASPFRDIWSTTSSPHERLVIGFWINRWAERHGREDSLFPTQQDLGYFGIGPVLFAIAQHLRSNRTIQDHYPRIHFASRDGHLPMLAYDYLCGESTERYIPASYLYCGRALYHAASYQNDPSAHLVKRLQTSWAGPSMTVGHLFDAMVAPGFLVAEDPRREQPVSREIEDRFPSIRSILAERGVEADRLLSERKSNLRDYYTGALAYSSERRALVFDCGYGGSVSTNIMKVSGGRIDKVYLCDTFKNRMTDVINRTRTILLFGDLHDIQPMGSLKIFEEIFSRLDAPCLALTHKDGHFVPVFDPSQPVPEETAHDVSLFQQAAMDFVRDIANRFGPVLDRMVIGNAAFSAAPLLASLQSPVDKAIRHFERVRFPDPYYGDHRPLSEKIEAAGRDHLLRTPFVDPAMIISRPRRPDNRPALRTALHLHLYHTDMAACFIERLVSFPGPYDLFISVCSQQDEQIARVLFSPLLERSVGRLVIRILPNRGRDTGAWVAGFGRELSTYDLAGHVHSKKSPHFPWGDQWRDYLLDNLITAEAFTDIQAHFNNDPALGLVFPPAYDGVFEFWGNRHLTHLEDVDRRNVLALMRRMGMTGNLTRHRLFFSVGTMFWYRPAALQPLIDLNLSFEDFDEEPVRITGSLAHAIERLPGIVAEHAGFITRSYVRTDALIDRFNRHRLQAIGAGMPVTRSTIAAAKFYTWLSQAMLPLLPPGTRRHRLAHAVAAKIIPGPTP